ncbi:HIRAN domain-containing protein [Thermodesulfovibrio yellowstonii]|uniref:HIRAN domain-containing protein n=1 Tax=Thermodesulfovibrio yellowstonii TaxID=28262 RepID=UPI003F8325B7
METLFILIIVAVIFYLIFSGSSSKPSSFNSSSIQTHREQNLSNQSENKLQKIENEKSKGSETRNVYEYKSQYEKTTSTSSSGSRRKRKSFSDYSYLSKITGSLVIKELPEQSFIEINKLPNKIEVINKEELERFEKHRNKIKEIIIRVPYYYEKSESKNIGESNIYVPANDAYINLESKAEDYFKNLNLIPIRTTLRIDNRIYNIFYLALNLDRHSLNPKIKSELLILKDNLNKRDLLRSSKFKLGMPDFFVIDRKNSEFFFCEVKSRQDKIQDHQKLWFLKNIIDFQTKVQYKLLKFLPEKIYETFECSIAGLRYRCDSVYLSGINLKEKMILEKDPQNPHDSYAIKVIRKKDNKHIGFIPRSMNKEIWKYLGNYTLNDCYVTDVKRLSSSALNSHKVNIKIVFEVRNIKH